MFPAYIRLYFFNERKVLVGVHHASQTVSQKLRSDLQAPSLWLC